MVDITLFELHLDDSTLTANAPFSDRKNVKSSSEPVPESSSRAKLIPTLVGLIFLIAVAYVAKRKLLDSEEETEVEVADVPV